MESEYRLSPRRSSPIMSGPGLPTGEYSVSRSGRELKVPLQTPDLRIEGQDGIRVQVVAETIIPDHVGSGIADRPVQRVELRIVDAGHPGGGARVRDRGATPRVRARLPGTRNGPEAPG